ncbi:MAG: succinate dehydrogenase/fumarate reductase cytochrome b subunit [Verrucomicrobia bacterium]|nr:MAG: succinate dehydrogenase/fumarate reductase cytochrome b subunit [Verrucomicrobiota bacterium]
MNASSCSLCKIWNSSIGKKYLVAITGLVLVLFLAGHLGGNLLIFVGKEEFDAYAKSLHELLHGAGVWIARAVLLSCLVIHVAATISLTRANRAASPKYGLTILAFVVYHLLHFTVRIDSHLAELAKTSPHAMVIAGFQNGVVVLFYVIAMTLLCSHLSHGVASIFQTVGLRSKKSAPLIDKLSKAYAWGIWAGFISIPTAIYFFQFGA